jgi:hypothetical protein
VTTLDADPLLRRLERRALTFCALAAAVALAVQPGQTEVALGVAGGGLLIGVSYWAIRSSIDGILALALPDPGAPPGLAPTDGGAGTLSGTPSGIAPGPVPPPAGGGRPAARADVRRARAIGYVLRFVGRFLVLAVLAYVMLVWLRLHPIGLVLGVSSIVVAAAIEAGSTLAGGSRA